MKDAEDEAFDELAKKQGDWGGGFQAKRAMAADKLQEPNTITFSTSSADWVMRITADRRIEVNEGVEVTETAQKVLEAMQWMLKPAQEPSHIVQSNGKHSPLLTHMMNKRTTLAQPAQDESDLLTIAYHSGYHDGKKAALAGREWNFCERCGKRTKDLTTIHTCTPPQEKNND